MSFDRVMLALVFTFLLTGCQTNTKLIGLWQIDMVVVGDEENTPIGRWTRINDDHTQESGNGWKQHSVGTWEYDKSSRLIEFETKNGVEDEYGAFHISKVEKEKMIWKRSEDDHEVSIIFKRIDKLPVAPANKLMGGWGLKQKSNKDYESYLFFRWDNILVKGDVGVGKIYGMYKTHGHKQEIQVVYYEDPLRQEVINFRFTKDDSLVLIFKEGGLEREEEYDRINAIPNY